jgi:hypothetical protein
VLRRSSNSRDRFTFPNDGLPFAAGWLLHRTLRLSPLQFQLNAAMYVARLLHKLSNPHNRILQHSDILLTVFIV